MRRLGSIVLALAVVALAGAYGLVGLLHAGFRCDESCEDPPEVWQDDPNSWQWDALGAFGLATAAASLVFLVGIALGRRTMSWVALAATSLAAAGFSAVQGGAGWGVLGLAGVVLIGSGAIALLPPRAHPTDAVD